MTTRDPSDSGRSQFHHALPGQQAQGPIVRVAAPPYTAWIVSHNTIGHLCHWLITDRGVRPIRGRTVPCLAHTGYCPHCAGDTDSHATPHWRGWVTVVPLGIRCYKIAEIRERHVAWDERLHPSWQGSLRGTMIRAAKDGKLATSPVELTLGDRPEKTADLPQDLDRVGWLLRVWGEHSRSNLRPEVSPGLHLLRPFEEEPGSEDGRDCLDAPGEAG